MVLRIETGLGVRDAESYVTASFITSYLTGQNRQAENGWESLDEEIQEAHAREASRFADAKHGRRLGGTREFSFSDEKATGSIDFTGVPSDGEQFTLGDETYTFKAALTGAADAVANEILIGVDADACASNVYDALTNNATNSGTTFSTPTVANRHATFTLESPQVELAAASPGEGGNDTYLVEVGSGVTNMTVTAFSGGRDGGSQPFEFPRASLFDLSGIRVRGVPADWKKAIAEYAVFAAGASLWIQPTIDERGGQVKRFRDKTGPLEEEIEYVEGTAGTAGAIPRPVTRGDALVAQYLVRSGGATR